MAIKIVEKKRKREERRPVVKSIHKLKAKKKKKGVISRFNYEPVSLASCGLYNFS